MNTLPLDKKLAVISALVEGNSIRSISRMTGVDRNTIASLLLRTGERCAGDHEGHHAESRCGYLQGDEIWTYVGKERQRRPQRGLAGSRRPMGIRGNRRGNQTDPVFRVGKRTRRDTWAFLWDLQKRLANRVQLTTDGLNHYTVAVLKPSERKWTSRNL